MAQFSYNRKYELIVSQPFTETLTDSIDQYKNTPLENDYIVYKDSGDYRRVNKQRNVTITELHIEATVQQNSKTSGGKNNTTTIRIYNLNKENQAIVQSKGNYVVLNAGYDEKYSGQSLPLVFSGQVSDCYTEKQGQDVVTTLVCTDGYTPNSAVRLSYRRPKGATYADVIKDFAKIYADNGVPTGELVLDPFGDEAFSPLQNTPTNTTLTRSYVATGWLRDAMDEICQSFNYTWQIVNGALYVHPRWYKNFAVGLEIGEDNILSIRSLRQGTRTTSSGSDAAEGLQITLFLEGRANTAKRLKILDGDNAGTYSISSVKHTLSYEGQQWQTTMDVLKV